MPYIVLNYIEETREIVVGNIEELRIVNRGFAHSLTRVPGMFLECVGRLINECCGPSPLGPLITDDVIRSVIQKMRYYGYEWNSSVKALKRYLYKYKAELWETIARLNATVANARPVERAESPELHFDLELDNEMDAPDEASGSASWSYPPTHRDAYPEPAGRLRYRLRSLQLDDISGVFPSTSRREDVPEPPPRQDSLPEPTPRDEPLPGPTHRSEPLPGPTHRSEPLPQPTHRSEPLPEPTHRCEPLPEPTHQCEPLLLLDHRCQPLAEPTHRCEPLPEPTHQCEPLLLLDHGCECLRLPNRLNEPLPEPTHGCESLPEPTQQSEPLPQPTHRSEPPPQPTHRSEPLPQPTHRSEPLPQPTPHHSANYPSYRLRAASPEIRVPLSVPCPGPPPRFEGPISSTSPSSLDSVSDTEPIPPMMFRGRRKPRPRRRYPKNSRPSPPSSSDEMPSLPGSSNDLPIGHGSDGKDLCPEIDGNDDENDDGKDNGNNNANNDENKD